MNTPNFYYLVASSSSCENDGSEGSYFGRNLHHTRHFPTSYSAVRAGSNFEVFSSSTVNLCLQFHLSKWIVFKNILLLQKLQKCLHICNKVLSILNLNWPFYKFDELWWKWQSSKYCFQVATASAVHTA